MEIIPDHIYITREVLGGINVDGRIKFVEIDESPFFRENLK